jgi:hypothetical protein
MHALQGSASPAVILCGDLNSEPDTGAIELLLRGHVSKDHYEWREFADFSWGAQEDEGVQGAEPAATAVVKETAAHHVAQESPAKTVGVDLRHSLALASACGLRTAFTNYVRGYIGCLDYVLFQDQRMSVSWVSCARLS